MILFVNNMKIKQFLLLVQIPKKHFSANGNLKQSKWEERQMNQFFILQLLKQSIFLKSIECFAERLVIEKHTKYYCSYKNIKKIFICVTITRKLRESDLSAFMSSKPWEQRWAGLGPQRRCLCATRYLSVHHPHLQRWVAQRHTLTHQCIEKQLKETDFEHPKQEPEWKVSVLLRKDGLFFGLRNK